MWNILLYLVKPVKKQNPKLTHQKINACAKCRRILIDNQPLCIMCLTEDSDSSASSGSKSSSISMRSYPNRNDLERRLEAIQAAYAEEERQRRIAEAEIRNAREKAIALMNEINAELDAVKRLTHEHALKASTLGKIKALEALKLQLANKAWEAVNRDTLENSNRLLFQNNLIMTEKEVEQRNDLNNLMLIGKGLQQSNDLNNLIMNKNEIEQKRDLHNPSMTPKAHRSQQPLNESRNALTRLQL